MKREIELLAPGGDLDAIKAAIIAGANAVYCGLDKFNARNRASNISFDNLQGILVLAHENNCQVFLTLNILITDSELNLLFNLLNKLVNTGIDGIIIQDLGLFYLLNKYFPSLKIHASTQLTTHNKGQIKFLKQLKATRVNLSRELNINEIKDLNNLNHQLGLLTEVFVHGSNCISFSGQCYMSSVQSGNSGNRGRCSQPCRDKYSSTNSEIDYPLNLKDNSAFYNLDELSAAGIDSLKIEGRIKKYDYVYTVVKTWSEQLKRISKKEPLRNDISDLYKVFNRDFSNGFLIGNIGKNAFIDDPRDYSLKRLSLAKESETEFLDKKEIFAAKLKLRLDAISINKNPIDIRLTGKEGQVLTIEVQSTDQILRFQSNSKLSTNGKEALSENLIQEKFRSLNDTEHSIKSINCDALEGIVFLPFKELNLLRKQIFKLLNHGQDAINAVKLPKLNGSRESTKPGISVLISSVKEMEQCSKCDLIYYQIRNAIKANLSELVQVFSEHTNLIPWFPAVIIGEDFDAAIDFIDRVKPKILVSNNTGIGYEANHRGIQWIAGPQLNISNSYALLCLKQDFNCSGAFISNELSQMQIRGIKKPDNFDLYFSIYHPNILMTSRLCLNHQINKCPKTNMDAQCLPNCKTFSSITNVKGQTSLIQKTKGNFHEMYDEKDYLNLDIVTDLPDKFASYMMDLRRFDNFRKTDVENSELINLFQNHINGSPEAKQQLQMKLPATSCQQYKKGI